MIVLYLCHLEWNGKIRVTFVQRLRGIDAVPVDDVNRFDIILFVMLCFCIHNTKILFRNITKAIYKGKLN